MNIAICTTPLKTTHATRGSGVYVKNLIEAIQKYESDHTVSFFTRIQEVPKNTDVVHYPFFDPFFLTLPLVKPFPTVVTVHDLIPLIFPEKFNIGIRGNVKWQVQKVSLLSSSKILTDSNNSKKDICRLIDCHSDDVVVVPLAPAPQYKRITDEAQLSRVRQKYHIPVNYVLYVGDVNWNKNIEGLLRAWQFVGHSTLVLVGSAFTNELLSETQEILSLITTLNIKESVIMTGHVEDEDMAALYSGAVCTVLPSWYEGFGFPVLESMLCAVPVVTANTSSLNEISGPSIRINPGNIDDIAGAIEQVLAFTPQKRKTIVQAGLDWASQFTWERVAHETLAVYQAAFNKNL